MLLPLLLACRPASAVENATTLCILYASGEEVAIPLAENPEVFFREGKVVIRAFTSSTVSFSDISELYFRGQSTEVGMAEVAGKTIEAVGGSVVLRHFAPGTAVRVFSLGGAVVKRDAVGSDGSLALSLADLPADGYIVRAGDKSFKFCKR